MIGSFYIAWRYVTFNKVRSATLIACVTLIAILPLTLELLLTESEQQLLSRAESTPLLLGAKGSALDLVMNGLYFDDEVPALVSMAAVNEVEHSGLAVPIPLYVRFNARGFPIVGTTLDYFDFRGLTMARGRQLMMLGEAVIGAEVASRLGISVGDRLLSSPETVFDLAGVYPLKMPVAGVLKRSYTPDDLAVFVDVKTTWVVQGLMHGHEALARSEDASVVIERTDTNVVANAKLVEYTEITEGNAKSQSRQWSGNSGEGNAEGLVAHLVSCISLLQTGSGFSFRAQSMNRRMSSGPRKKGSGIVRSNLRAV